MARTRRPRVFVGVGAATLPGITVASAARTYTQEGLYQTLRRIIACAEKSGASAEDMQAARIAAEAFRRAQIDVRLLKPKAESRRRSDEGLAKRRYKPPMKAAPDKIREVLRTAESNKEAARRLRVSTRTVVSYKKKYAQR